MGKEYGRNIDFNKYGLRPSGSYLDATRKDFEELLGSMDAADEAVSAPHSGFFPVSSDAALKNDSFIIF